jgi:hypothetical protein
MKSQNLEHLSTLIAAVNCECEFEISENAAVIKNHPQSLIQRAGLGLFSLKQTATRSSLGGKWCAQRT